jgi:hypothetical protein
MVMGEQGMPNPYRKQADEYKLRLRRAFRHELAEGDQAIAIVAALAEMLVEIATGAIGPQTTTELLKHMIDEIERHPDNPRAV